MRRSWTHGSEAPPPSRREITEEKMDIVLLGTPRLEDGPFDFLEIANSSNVFFVSAAAFLVIFLLFSRFKRS